MGSTHHKMPFGASQVALPRVGLGTWMMETDDQKEVIATLRAGLDQGLTYIDTAEMYGSGQVESLVGEALLGRRQEVFLTSKVLPENAGYEGTLVACEESLKRLRTDYLDLYLLHWRGRKPLSETFCAFERLLEQGKIRFFGVSNFDVTDLEEAIGLVGSNKIVCNQVLYHLEERVIEKAVLPFCRKHNIAVVAYSPFAQGQFPSATSAGGKVLGEIATRHHVTSRQVALAFLLRNPEVFTIPKTSKVKHVLENGHAMELVLTPAELGAIETVFPLGKHRRLRML